MTDMDLVSRLRAFGQETYPGVSLKSPWPGHADLAVADKTFAYLSAEGDPPSVSLKLPYSAPEVLARPGAKPTGYGLGKSSWVTLDLAADDPPTEAELRLWLDESYRAQAPKGAGQAIAGRPWSQGLRRRNEP